MRFKEESPKTVNSLGNNVVQVIEWNNISPLFSIYELQEIDVVIIWRESQSVTIDGRI